MPRQKIYSFLSVGWGLIADIDIESEGLRFIGGSRFVLWSIYRSIGNYYHSIEIQSLSLILFISIFSFFFLPVPKTYRGRLSYLPIDSKKLISLNQKHNSSDNIKIEVNTNQGGDVTDSSTIQRSFNPSSNGNSSSIEDTLQDISDNDDDDGGDDVRSSPSPNQDYYIPPLWEDVPSNWVTIEDDFIMVQSSSQSHLSPTVHFAPESELADGVIWLAYLTSKVSIKNLLRFLSSLETARHIDLPYLKWIPVRAYRLEPLTPNGIISIDGESFNAEPCQVQVLPSMGKIFKRDDMNQIP